MKIKQYLIEYIRIMLYTIIILLSIFTGFAPGLFRFSLVTCILYLIFIIPLIWIILIYVFPRLENIYKRLKNG